MNSWGPCSALLLALSCATPATAAKAAPCPDSAQSYWTTFRAAALKGDVKTVAGLTRFPLEVHGPLDESDEHSVARSQLGHWWPRLLNADPGLSAEATTMKSYVLAHPRLQDGFCTAEGQQFRVGEWLFHLGPEGWRFVIAYVNE
ncbi:hypothetical protein OOT46_14230 [Aquabacterium sp. A7-Y]|uniref:hypothetical protein n=1 Tax=Aquabacterium sp. A7-Y TaxID=1349605 RepID=UPI00223D9439|nr:hypothetical protein [Aquabacterium sp. A7-Y]MCW7538999.1 hypothetical protein [Aquabacterium sp. A7-Y]